MAAEVLAAEMPALAGDLLVVFQPAEELLSGAAATLRDGALDGARPDAALAVHMNNDQPVGTIGLRSGPVMASADRIEVTVRGRGGHGALPHLARDPWWRRPRSSGRSRRWSAERPRRSSPRS